MFELKSLGALNFASRSVFARCAVLLALSTSVVATTQGVMSLVTAERVAETGVRNQAVRVTSLVADQTGGGIKFQKADSVDEIIETLMTDSGGVAIGSVATDLQGDILGSAGETGSGALEALAASAAASGELAVSEDGFTVAAPVRFGKDNTVVGAVAAQWTPAPLKAAIRRDQIEAAAVAFGLFVASLLLATLVTRQTISRPLVAVSEAMRRVAAKEFLVEIPATGRRDEIGGIANTLESFRRSLAAAEKPGRGDRVQGRGVRRRVLGDDADGRGFHHHDDEPRDARDVRASRGRVP